MSGSRLIHKSLLLFSLFTLLLLSAPAGAAPTTSEQALMAARTFLSLEAAPLGEETLGREVMTTVETHADDLGVVLYYIVHLQPSGLIIVSGDDLVEPIIGFGAGAVEYDPFSANPLGALVESDLAGRVALARQIEGTRAARSSAMESANQKWQLLTSGATARAGLSTISDVRVSPLLSSTWSQENVDGQACYNYYTPSNYVCGCVATAMAQLMRFWEHPTAGVGTASFFIKVDGGTQSEALMGGDGSGGAYSWPDMPLSPGAGITTAQRQAIGRLTHDAGVAVGMSYTSESSGADTLQSANAFTNTFQYSNAKPGFNSGYNLPEAHMEAAVNTNLDGGFPVILGITGDGGHAIVCDGYGYNLSVIYHHLNMGWSGSDNFWYNLPTIETTYYTFNSVYKTVYNVFVSGSGQIISGRVLDESGNPVEGAEVTASAGGIDYTDTTDAKGIYALARIPSSTTYTINVTTAGHDFLPTSATTGTAYSYSTTTGNVWGKDIRPTSGAAAGMAGLWGLLLN